MRFKIHLFENVTKHFICCSIHIGHKSAGNKNNYERSVRTVIHTALCSHCENKALNLQQVI